MRAALLRLACALLVSGTLPACLTEEKTLDLVITGETSADFAQNETSSTWVTGAVINVGQALRDILHENGYTEDDIKNAHVTSLHYGVTSFDQAHDWMISGSIDVSVGGAAPVVVMQYESQSVQDALGRKIPVVLDEAGVDVINNALQDFLAGENTLLMLTINNASTSPLPTEADPMAFSWRSWLAIQIILDETVEVPDPF